MEEQGTHFFFITIQQGNARGYITNTLSGTVTPRLGQSRFDLFTQTRARFEQLDPRIRDGIVIAFDIQPNTL